MNSYPLMQHILELKAWHEAERGNGVAIAEEAELIEDTDGEESQSNGSPAYVPTPAEIRAACLRIQKEWSETERRRRAGWRDSPRSRMVHMLRVDTIW